MRKTVIVSSCCVFLLLAFYIGHISSAQSTRAQSVESSENSTTKLEAFMARKGTLSVKELYKVGGVLGRRNSSAMVRTLVMYEPGMEDEATKGIQVEVDSGKEYSSSNISFLDMEEVKSLSAALKYMLILAAKWGTTDRYYTEINFRTKGGLNVGFVQDGTKQTGFIQSGNVGPETCYLGDIIELGTLKEKVDKAVERLK